MDNNLLQNIGQITGEYFAALVIISFFAIKTFSTVYNSFKDIISEKKKIKINDKSDININFGENNPTLKLEPGSILLLLLQQSKILSEFNNLQKVILSSQMDYYNRQMEAIKIKYTTTLCVVLTKADVHENDYDIYYKSTENFIDICGYKLNSLFRRSCKDNHFSKKSPQEFRDLIDRNIQFMENAVEELIRKRYPQKNILKYFSEFDHLREDIRIVLRSSFDYARDVAILHENKVHQQKTEFEKEIYKITGKKYTID